MEAEKAIHAFTAILEQLDQYSRLLADQASSNPENDLPVSEFILTIDLLKHACMRGIFGYNPARYAKKDLATNLDRIVARYQQIWLLRNRPGGLKDSLSYFEITKSDYQ